MNVIDTVKSALLNSQKDPDLNDHYTIGKGTIPSAFVPTLSPTVNALVAAHAVKVDYQKDRSPEYHGADDTIHMLPPEAFADDNAYTLAFAHELSHWTGKHDRLGRMLPEGLYNWQQGAEEMTAQLGAALLLEKDGLYDTDAEKYTADYVRSWATVAYLERPKLRDEDALVAMLFGPPDLPMADQVKAFDKAAADAQEAVAFLLSAL